MVTYLIKSTISLIAFYGFFHFFLRKHKVLLFNRFYLISSMIFSLLIPFVKIPVESIYTLSISINKIPFIQDSSLQSEQMLSNAPLQHLHQNVFPVLLFIISSFLVLRFSLNLLKITKKIYKSERIKNPNFTLVLVNEKILPYSFFKFIFLNKADFENEKVEKELIKHEEVHCLQYHSVDIIMLELINIVLWFNPIIWLFRRAIRLNHEYFADNRVLTQTDSSNYYSIFVNLLTQNNTNYLVSNFKYSLIKNRLIMMTNDGPLRNILLKKSSAILLFIAIGSIVTFSQKTINPKNTSIEVPLSQKTINPRNSGIDNAKKPQLVYANSATIFDKIILFKGNVKIRIADSDSSFTIIKADSATFDNEKNIYLAYFGTMEKFISGNPKPFKTTSFHNLRYDFKSGITFTKNTKGENLINGK
jgi:hypothetical protein